MCISHILSLKNTSAVFFLCYPAVFSTAEYCPCYKWVFYGYKWVINGYFVFFYTNVQLRVGEKKNLQFILGQVFTHLILLQLLEYSI